MILTGDSLAMLKTLADESVDCCVTSPPYWGLRDYGIDGQIGLEESFGEWKDKLVAVFDEARRVLKPDGTLWLNIGDSYAGGKSGLGGGGNRNNTGSIYHGIKKDVVGCKPKDLIGQAWTMAFALRDAGWWLRQCNIWHKPNPMPESVTDRTTTTHEYMFHLSKSARYYYDAKAIYEQGFYHPPGQKACSNTRNDKQNGQADLSMRNKRTVWTIPTQPLKDAHFATYPEELVRPCILAGCRPDGIVLDPFFGSGTTGLVAAKLGRKFIGIELNPKFVSIARKRLGLFAMEVKC